jgi:hypothetical protein
MTLPPKEATPRALALLTVAHEIYSAASDDEIDLRGLDDDIMVSVLSDDSGEIDWKAIALALAMLGHLVIEKVLDTLYDEAEMTIREAVAAYTGGKPENYSVVIQNRISGTDLLRQISLQIAAMNEAVDPGAGA